jgi:DNA-binding NtrC family response regulator
MSTPPLRMLVAEDSSAVQALFADAAKRSASAIEIRRAVNGTQCREALGSGNVDLAFIDVHMPDMSGMEALAFERYACNKTFVTLMSTLANRPKYEIARVLKVYEFLTKPFPIGKIDEIVQTYQRVRLPVRALIVDDSATARRLIVKVISGSLFNISVEEAKDGLTAVAACAAAPFDIVFLDLNMPGVDGMQVLEQIRKRHPDSQVVMMSGARDIKHKIVAQKAGAIDFLFKPFGSADVDRILHAVFKLRLPLLWAA